MSFGAAPGGGGMDEYQRLMAERNAAAKKKRMLFGRGRDRRGRRLGYFVMTEPQEEEAAQEILDAGGRFAERDKADMGAFWTCVMGTDTDVGMFQSADQIQQRIESAYFTQQKTYSEHLTTDCVPKLEGAQGSLSGLANEMPDGAQAAAREVRGGDAQDAGGPRELRREAEVARRGQGRRRQHPGGRRRVHDRPDAGVGRVREVHGVRHPRPGQEEGHPGGARVPRRDLQEGSGRVHDQGARGLRQRWCRTSTRTRSRRRRRRSRRTRRSSGRRSSASCRPGSAAARGRARARRCSTSRRS